MRLEGSSHTRRLLVRPPLRRSAVLGGGTLAASYLYLPDWASRTTASRTWYRSRPRGQAKSQGEALSGSVEAPAILVYSNPEGLPAADLEV